MDDNTFVGFTNAFDKTSLKKAADSKESSADSARSDHHLAQKS